MCITLTNAIACSPVALCAQRYGTGKAKGRLRCGLSEAKGKIGLMEDFYFYACGGEKENQRRNSGDDNRRN